MTNLTRFETADGIELVIDTQTGEAFATQRGYARMSGRDQSTISRRCAKLDESGIIKDSEIDTGYGIKVVSLIPLQMVMQMLLENYHRNPTQQSFKTLVGLYKYQGLEAEALTGLHDFNKGDRKQKKIGDREKQVQLAYRLKHGGQLEYPTANGRIDLLTDTTIYKFKNFKGYKECLGQLLAYDDCIPHLKLVAVLFGVPKALKLDGGECQRVESLLRKYGITTEFLH